MVWVIFAQITWVPSNLPFDVCLTLTVCAAAQVDETTGKQLLICDNLVAPGTSRLFFAHHYCFINARVIYSDLQTSQRGR